MYDKLTNTKLYDKITNKTTKDVLYTYARMHCSCIVCTYVCISHMEVGRCNVDVQMKRCWLICSFVNAIKISQLICSSRQNSFPVWSRWVQTTNLTVYTRSCVLLYIVIYLLLDNGILLFRSYSFFSFCLHCDCNTCRRSLFFLWLYLLRDLFNGYLLNKRLITKITN